MLNAARAARSPHRAARLSEKLRGAQLLLATDLDGTFLGGSESDRRRLYEFLKHRPAETALAFVTGRGLETVIPLLSDPSLPRPDLIICDVGATVVHGHDLEPVLPLQNRIAQLWPGTHQVLHALEGLAGLERQDVPQERRCSFYAQDPGLRAAVEARVAPIGCEVMFSAGRYLDVLPRGVNKGSTLQALVDEFEIPSDRVLTAGDTLNDQALLGPPFRGVLVGNAEPGLVEALRPDGARLLHARHPGAGGILEALAHFGFAAPAELGEGGSNLETRPAQDQLVMVYHRQPFEETRRGGKSSFRAHKSPNGIIPTLLGFFGEGRPGSWVAWAEVEEDERASFEPKLELPVGSSGRVQVARVPLAKRDVELFYKKFSKEAFWPIIFSFPSRAVFNQEHWLHYLEINRAFADRTAEEAEPGATVWIHDYNLWMVPAFLRPKRPDLRIAFFHHTAFPPADVFNIIPWSREIVTSLLLCDYVGFHIPRYVENFVDVARSRMGAEVVGRVSSAPRFRTYGCAMGVDDTCHALRYAGREVGLGAHPVGIDVTKVRETLARPEVAEQVRTIRAELQDRRCILSVERLDYVKGPIEKLRAFQALLEAHPELHEKVVLVSVCTPAAPGMEVYQGTRRQVDELVGQINGRFSTVSWTPIRYFYRSLPFEDVLAYYAAADVAWITPLRDGLNLVAKEFVAAQDAVERNGALVVSEFAGVAVELHGALLTNPYDPLDMRETLYKALHLDELDREIRRRRLASIVSENDVAAWGRSFLAAARGG